MLRLNAWCGFSVLGVQSLSTTSSHSLSHSHTQGHVLLHLVLIIPGSFALVRLLSRKKDGRPPPSILPEDSQSDQKAIPLAPSPAPLLSTPIQRARRWEDTSSPERGCSLRGRTTSKTFCLFLTAVLLSRVAHGFIKAQS